MVVLRFVPLLASLGPVAVGVSKRRASLAVAALVVFDIGYVAVLMAEGNGANSPWHLVWLLGMVLLSWGVAPRPGENSWWADRYGYGTHVPGIWAATPVTAIALVFLLPGIIPPLQWLLHPLVVLLVLAAVVLGPILGGIVGWATGKPMWRSYAVMGGASGLVLASVAVAYGAGAFVFGF